MCGIAGYIGKKPVEKDNIKETLRLMRNRGPDFQDFCSIEEGGLHISLLHSRLKIIDFDDRSNQPFISGGCVLIFNGEIYNYVELRKALEEKGARFRTESDTEVLLEMYLRYGERCVDKLEGMWGFAIYDKRLKKLILSRDRFGEKPLYYLEDYNGIYFGSEIKFIKSLAARKLKINQRHLFRYLVNGYKSLYKTEETFFSDVRPLAYATNLVVDRALRIDRYRYWEPAYKPADMTADEAVGGLRSRLLESVKIRLRADVPLAFCLSGGIDSASLSSIARKEFNYDVATFSIIDTDERYNEYENIRMTIDDIGCRHTIIYIPKEEFAHRLRKLIGYHDAPISTISYYVHSFLSEAISREGYRVAVSGTAADELLTGYYDHFNLYLYEMKESPRYEKYLREWKEYISGYVRNPYLQNPQLYFDNPGFRNHIYLNRDYFAKTLKADFDEEFYESHFCNSPLRNRMLNELFHEAIPVILHEDDLNSMYYSIENRSPYLDSRLFAFAYSIPTEYLISGGYGKYILREAVRGILNEKVRLDRRKIGFNASINSLVDFKDEGTRGYFLGESKIFDLVDRRKIEELLNKDPMPNSFSKFLFNFINAKVFMEQN